MLHSSARHGAALIIAIVILAGLLILGLPFLFTQSGSLSGTRSYAHDNLASVGQSTAQNMGIAIAVKTVQGHWLSTEETPPNNFNKTRNELKALEVNDWTSLREPLQAINPTSGVKFLDTNRIQLDTRQHTYEYTAPNPAIIGITIEDESGKLNPNYLDQKAWKELLDAVGIKDWQNISTSGVGYGSLTVALAGLRYTLPGKRITQFIQLRLAQPVIPPLQTPAPNPLPVLRGPLTDAELALLKPHLTLHTLGTGGGGQIDIGTVIDVHPDGLYRRAALDSEPPGNVLSFPVPRNMVGVGSTLILGTQNGDVSVPALSAQQVDIGDSVKVDVPPTVNIHTATSIARRVLFKMGEAIPNDGKTSFSLPPSPAKFTGLHSIQSSETDFFGNKINGLDAAQPLHHLFLGSEATVLPSQQGDPGISPTTIGVSQDASNKPLLESGVTLIRISGSARAEFPGSGYAQLIGKKSGTNEQVTELIYYNSSLPLSSSDAQAIAPSILVNVRRGRIKPDGTLPGPFEFFADTLKIKPIIPRDLPPLSIRSQGVVAIESSATVLDRADKIAASEQHRAIAQALPQEAVLEERFEKQAQFHNLIAQRHGSLLTSFPKPYPRINDLYPDDQDNEDVPDIDLTDSKEAPGLKPAPMRSLLTTSHLNHDWTLPFSGQKGTAISAQDYTAESDITPEGVRLKDGIEFSQTTPGKGLVANAVNPSTANQLVQIDSRQFSLWVRPDDNWKNRQIALLDMRVPINNAGEYLSGAQKEEGSQDGRDAAIKNLISANRFCLRYNGETRELILEINPGTIPHISDYGPLIPRCFYGKDTDFEKIVNVAKAPYPSINPECLGVGGVKKMATAPVVPQSIQIRYYVGDDGMNAGQWYLIQAAFTNNTPDGMSIMVDGLIGRDITQMPSDANPGPMKLPGDHVAIPNLRLATNELESLPDAKLGAESFYLPKIELTGWGRDENDNLVIGKAAVSKILPQRGVIRINNEYISYQSLDSTSGTLENCVRGRRQQTNAELPLNNSINWNNLHKIETHKINSPVFPGGFAIKNIGVPGNTLPLYRGGWKLAYPMPDGDPDPNNFYQVWGATAQEYNVGETSLLLNAGFLEFPRRGYVAVESYGAGNKLYYKEYYFDSVSGDSAKVRMTIYTWGEVTNTTTGEKSFEWISGLTEPIPANRKVILMSQEIIGDPKLNPADKRYYAPTNGLVQLYDARGGNAKNRGRCEWISYSEIRSDTKYPEIKNENNKRFSFITNISSELVSGNLVMRPGFWFNATTRNGARGAQRTAFAGYDFKEPDKYQFPVEPDNAARVIPVQTQIDLAYLLEAGDVVTLMPSELSKGQKPIQMCVRFSADDGFPERKTTTEVSWDTTNHYFAFTEAIPDEWNPSNKPFHLLCWPCWTAVTDLSPVPGANYLQQVMNGSLPWINNYGIDYGINDSTRMLHMGQEILVNSATGAVTFKGSKATFDALHAGTQPGSDILQKKPVRVKTYRKRPDKPNPLNPDAWEDISTGFDALDLSKELLLESTESIFTPPYGLVTIGGEVFAYKNDLPAQSTQAKIIARGLLGSVRKPHVGDEIIMHLPLGPVDEIRNALNENLQGEVLFAGQSIDAPAVLLVSRDGKKREIVTFPNGHTAPWLRGLYNTTPVAWKARPTDGSIINDAPIAIGWWPRYPPALPRDTLSQRGDIRAALLRCRSYAWANFPFRFHQTYFKGDEPSTLTILDNPMIEGQPPKDYSMFDFYAFALRGGLSWDNWDGVKIHFTQAIGNSEPFDISDVFQSAQFHYADLIEYENNATKNSRSHFNAQGNNKKNAFVDGVDVRVIWTYNQPPIKTEDAPSDWLRNAARNANHAPKIGPTIIRGRAPSTVLSVER
jgi:hypothetical protein